MIGRAVDDLPKVVKPPRSLRNKLRHYPIDVLFRMRPIFLP
jgi:hypothetical protein